MHAELVLCVAESGRPGNVREPFLTEERCIVSLLAIPFSDLEDGGAGLDRSGNVLRCT